MEGRVEMSVSKDKRMKVEGERVGGGGGWEVVRVVRWRYLTQDALTVD